MPFFVQFRPARGRSSSALGLGDGDEPSASVGQLLKHFRQPGLGIKPPLIEHLVHVVQSVLLREESCELEMGRGKTNLDGHTQTTQYGPPLKQVHSNKDASKKILF